MHEQVLHEVVCEMEYHEYLDLLLSTYIRRVVVNLRPEKSSAKLIFTTAPKDFAVGSESLRGI